MAHDLVIKNGTVIDGTGSPGFTADVAVDGDKISAIGKNLGGGKKEIDANGQVVAPGFIDSHTHMDAFVVQYPNGNPVVNYGVTSIVIGDCGASCAPVPPKPEPRKVLVEYLRRVLDKYVDDKDWRWNTFGEYLNYLEGKIAINCLPLMPHSPVRLTVMGEAAYQRAANPEELNAMKAMVREGMELGAIGFSTSPRGGPAIHAGTPSTFAEHDEIIQLANVAAEYNGCFQFNGFQMILQPESGVPEMLTKIKALQIGNEFRVRPGAKAAGMESIRYMEDAQKRGQDIYGVVIPYQHIRRFNLDDCFLFNGLPTWEAIKNAPDLKAKLSDKETRRKIEQERIACQGKLEFAEWAWLGSRCVRAFGKAGAQKTRTKEYGGNRPPDRETAGGCILRYLVSRTISIRKSSTMAWPTRTRNSRRDDQIRHQLDRHRCGRAFGSFLLAWRADQDSRLLEPRKASHEPRASGAQNHRLPGQETALEPRSLKGRPARRHHGFRCRQDRRSGQQETAEHRRRARSETPSAGNESRGG